MLICQGVFHPIYIYIQPGTFAFAKHNRVVRPSTGIRPEISQKIIRELHAEKSQKKKNILIFDGFTRKHYYYYYYYYHCDIYIYIYSFIYLYTCINPLFLDIQFSSFNRHRFWVDSRFQPSFRSLNPQQGSSW